MSYYNACRRTGRNDLARVNLLRMSSGQVSDVSLKKTKKKKHVFKGRKLSKKAVTPVEPKVRNNETKTTLVRKPFKSEEVSSNWKNLLQVIKPPHTGTLPPYRKRKLASSTNEPDSKKQTTNSSRDDQSTETKTDDVWFDNVDPILLEGSSIETSALTQNEGTKELTKIVALDCEMVGVGADGEESALARVSVVNQYGHCVYDKYVLPGEEVTDYRTKFSGIRPHNLKNALYLGTVQHEVSELLRGRILVGHALKHDLQVLMIRHPKPNIRDTSRYKPFRKLVNGATPSLKLLTQTLLGIEIQSGEHSSVQDAQAAMRLYTMVRQNWEADLSSSRKERKGKMLKAKSEKLNKKKPETKVVEEDSDDD